jgi:hypothetical protein
MFIKEDFLIDLADEYAVKHIVIMPNKTQSQDNSSLYARIEYVFRLCLRAYDFECQLTSTYRAILNYCWGFRGL